MNIFLLPGDRRGVTQDGGARQVVTKGGPRQGPGHGPMVPGRKRKKGGPWGLIKTR